MCELLCSGRVCQAQDWRSNHKFECPNLQKQAALAASSSEQVANGAVSKPAPPDPNEDAPVPQQVLFPYQHYLQLSHNRNSCRKPPVGFTNLGNNCYANAALQCLLANKPLRAYLDQGLHSSSCNKPSRHEWCLLCELQVICKRLDAASAGDEVSIRPLLRHLRRFAKTLSYGRQEDAHEFFYSLLNTMEAIQLTNYGGKERFDMRTQETTLVHHVFGGYLRSQVICGGCGGASRRYEAALDLQLEVPPAVDKLEDALARHTADEVLDGENRYACDDCRQGCRATRSTRFEVAPNTLVLCLKRFGTGRFGKINKMLSYGEHLDLRPYMAEGAMDDGEVTYTLSGVIVHLDQMNSTSFGHYICFIRTADGRWYCCDDASVAPTSVTRVLGQNAYMLFYQRDVPKPAPQPGFKRAIPLTPAAIQPAAAASPPAAAVQQHPDQPVMANGAAGLAQQQEQAEPHPLPDQQQQPLHAEHLARVSTAPAALVHMAEDLGSSSSNRDEEDSSPRSSLNGGPSTCSTPMGPIAAAANGRLHQRSFSSRSASSSDSRTDSLPADQPANGPLHPQSVAATAEADDQHQQQEASDNEQPTSSCRSSCDQPQLQYQLSRCGPELLTLRVELPGVANAADVSVDVLAAGPQLQRLQLKVPGKFATLDVPLAQELAGGQQLVESVSGKFYKRRQMLRLHLHLVSQQQQQQQDEGSGNIVSYVVPDVVHWHSTDAGETSSSGSDSEGFMMPHSSFRSVMSELNLSSYLGRHSSQGLVQGLLSQQLEQQDDEMASGETATVDAHTAAGGGDCKPSKPKSGGKKSGSKKSSKGKKRK
eukprot:GHUV01006806.1.p1 GENE.GHUV01006806.1~~GHUV01006806.1.p1  ORF type:complete len:820 (+),score=282.32 GHUV01006806.1:139-2598(+)